MKSKKFGFLKHYKKIKIEGLNLNNIINKCIKNRIDLRNLRCNDNLESTVEIKNEDYESFKKIAGYSYKISVLEEGGMYAFFKLIKTNILTVVGAFLLGALIFYQSLFIAEIRVEGYRQITETEIREVLKEYGIAEGERRKEDYREVKTALYKNFDQLSWVSIYEKGRMLKVKVAEAGKIEEEKEINTEPANIVAKKSGMIEKIVPIQGNAKVEKGDYVNEGDLLISGKYKYQSTDYSKGDKEFVLYSHAMGNVMAKVPLQLTFFMEKDKRELIPTKKVIWGLNIKSGDYEIDTTRVFCKFKISKKKETVMIDMKRYFPLKISVVAVREMNVVKRHNDMKKAREVVEAAVRQYAKNNFTKDTSIVSQKINFFEGENIITAEVFLELIEDIGVEKTIKVKNEK